VAQASDAKRRRGAVRRRTVSQGNIGAAPSVLGRDDALNA